jgi:uncharacterized membrane protein
MWRKFATSLVLAGCAAGIPGQALAQVQNPPWDTWFGQWSMWGGWSSWWWICPLMMALMMLAMMFACRLMCSRHRQ